MPIIFGLDTGQLIFRQTVTDIRPGAGRQTAISAAAAHARAQGVRLVIRSQLGALLFHLAAELLYEANIVEQGEWQPAQYSLASLNFGSLADHSAFQVGYTEDDLCRTAIRFSAGHFLQ